MPISQASRPAGQQASERAGQRPSGRDFIELTEDVSDSPLWRRVAFYDFVSALVLITLRAANFRLEHHPIPPSAAEISERRPSVGRMLLDELVEAREQLLDHVRSNGVIQHGRRAYLDRARAQQEIRERLGKFRDPANPRERLVRERLAHARHVA
jgi:hypothetical protein